MNSRNLLTSLAAFLVQPFLIYSASQPNVKCPSMCTCPSNFKILCKNASFTEAPSGIPNTVITLDLSYNAISNLTGTSFSNKGMSQLTSLYIYNNKIRNIDPEAFKSLKNLKSLFMGDNKLTYIHPDTFKCNTNLEELDLHGNNISLRDKGPFRDLVNLFSLNLASCNLNRIPNATFQGTVKLSRLDMSNNKLTDIDDHLFDDLNSLKVLNLSGNVLTSVDFLLVLSTRSLQEISLYVYDNKLANLSTDILKRMGDLKNLDMHKNPLFCRCWDGNLPLNVLQKCFEFMNYWQIYVHDCLNKTAPVSVAEVITMETRSTEASVSEELDFDILGNGGTIIPQDVSGLNFVNNDLSVVTDAPVLQNSSKNISKTDLIIITVTMSVTLVILILMYLLLRILKGRPSVSDESDSVPHEDNHQQERQCKVCQIYQNYTPNCDHRLSRQNMNTSEKNKLKFAIQQHHVAVLEEYETLTQEEYEESCLYVPQSEEILRHITNSHSDCAQSNLVPTTIPCDKEIETGTTSQKHSSCTPENHEDTVLMCVGNTSGHERGITTFPRHSRREHSCDRSVSYVPHPSDRIHLSGKNRHSCLERPQYLYSQSWSPLSQSPPVPRHVESLMNRSQRRTLPQQMHPRTICDRVTSRRQSPTVSHSLDSEHIYEEIK